MLKLSGFTKLVIAGASAAHLANAVLAARPRVVVEPRSHRFLAKMMFEGVFGTRSGGTAEITGLYTQWSCTATPGVITRHFQA
ncbi:hypothetical protein WJX82_003360 [Trebouxia sp. C0006]